MGVGIASKSSAPGPLLFYIYIYICIPSFHLFYNIRKEIKVKNIKSEEIRYQSSCFQMPVQLASSDESVSLRTNFYFLGFGRAFLPINVIRITQKNGWIDIKYELESPRLLSLKCSQFHPVSELCENRFFSYSYDIDGIYMYSYLGLLSLDIEK